MSDAELSVPTTGEVSMQGVVTNAVGQAKILQRAIDEQGLATTIQGRRHINVEGWQLVLALNNTVPVITESRPVTHTEGELTSVVGYEAHCELRDGALVVGSGWGQCMRAERTWAKRDDYALRSMAETRAIGKACRNRFGFLAKIAGFEATPQEEMHAAMSPEHHAKMAVFDMCDGNPDEAKQAYERALDALGYDRVTTDAEAEAVVAQATVDMTGL